MNGRLKFLSLCMSLFSGLHLSIPFALVTFKNKVYFFCKNNNNTALNIKL